MVGKPLGYLTLQVMEYNELYTKEAAAHGVPGLKVTFVTNLTGQYAVDAILSGAVDIAQYSPDVLLTLWSKTTGTPQAIKGIIGKGAIEFVLNTRNPQIHSIHDFTDNDRIAVAGVKVSEEAMLLEMAAAKEFGDSNWGKLDNLTVTSGAPDAFAQLTSSVGQITADFTVPPYTYLEQQSPGIHRVLSSYDIIGGDLTSGVEFTTQKFHDANPRLIAAFIDAMKDATNIITHDRGGAIAAYYAESGDTTTKKEVIEMMLDDPHTNFNLAPTGIMKIADFMSKHGIISRMPSSWKDVFFPEVYGFNGS